MASSGVTALRPCVWSIEGHSPGWTASVKPVRLTSDRRERAARLSPRAASTPPRPLCAWPALPSFPAEQGYPLIGGSESPSLWLLKTCPQGDPAKGVAFWKINATASARASSHSHNQAVGPIRQPLPRALRRHRRTKSAQKMVCSNCGHEQESFEGRRVRAPLRADAPVTPVLAAVTS